MCPQPGNNWLRWGVVPRDLHSSSSCFTHGLMECGFHFPGGRPTQELSHSLSCSCSPVFQSLLLFRQGWEVVGDPIALLMLPSPGAWAPQILVTCGGRKFREGSRPPLYQTSSLHPCPHIFVSIGWKQMSKNGNICTISPSVTPSRSVSLICPRLLRLQETCLPPP